MESCLRKEVQVEILRARCTQDHSTRVLVQSHLKTVSGADHHLYRQHVGSLKCHPAPSLRVPKHRNLSTVYRKSFNRPDTVERRLGRVKFLVLTVTRYETSSDRIPSRQENKHLNSSF